MVLTFFKYLCAELHSALTFNRNRLVCHWGFYFLLLVGCSEKGEFDVYHLMHMNDSIHSELILYSIILVCYNSNSSRSVLVTL